MIATLLIGLAAATALLLAAAAGFSSLVSTLLCVYIAFTANLGITTLALSPFREVTRTGLAVTELVLFAAALALWWVRGRRRLPLVHARAAARAVVSDPVTALFLVAVLVLLAYELVLGLTVPPNNGDALFYHLPRAAAWAQHGGVYWIPNSPNVELNEYQPLAEQQLLYLFVATHSGVLLAVPQFLGELAILVAVYGAARRLGFEVRAAASATFLLATFSLLALEATTAQNDLVAGSFVAVAGCMLLGTSRLELALAGASAAFGLGTKLTVGLALPTLVLLALVRGRRAFAWAVAGGAAGFAALGMWGYVLNAIHTGHVFGVGTALLQDRGSPGYPRSVALAFYLMYGTMDLSILSNHLIRELALAGIVLAALVIVARRRSGIREALGVALPFVSGMLVIGGAAVIAWIAYLWGFPLRGPKGILLGLNTLLNEQYTHISHEDYSAFGPVGIVALLAAAAITVWAVARRRADARQLVLATALPLFLVLISLEAVWVPYLIRFFVLPAVLAAPLLARLLRGRATIAAFAVASCLTVGLTIAHAQTKPLESRYGYGRPWDMTEEEALITNSNPSSAGAYADYVADIPANACVGAYLDIWEQSYLLYGGHLQHHVVYLSKTEALTDAIRHGLYYVVVGDGPNALVASGFANAGWKLRPLGTQWELATAPHAGDGRCAA